MLQTSTLRPGLLVGLATRLSGNVEYTKRTLEEDHVTTEGQKRAQWETTRVIADPQEHETAVKVRSQASALIRGVCAKSAFGLLCPEADAAKLERAINSARELVDDFNRTAKLTRIAVYTITGRIAPDDEAAVRAINSEIRELLAEMEAGVKSLDVAMIRDAANKARSVGQMLSPAAYAKVENAIEAVRKTARAISKAGEQASLTIDAEALKRITDARTTFLDLDAPAANVAIQTEAAPAIDLQPEVPVTLAAAPAPQPSLEF